MTMYKVVYKIPCIINSIFVLKLLIPIYFMRLQFLGNISYQSINVIEEFPWFCNKHLSILKNCFLFVFSIQNYFTLPIHHSINNIANNICIIILKSEFTLIFIGGFIKYWAICKIVFIYWMNFINKIITNKRIWLG